METPFLVVIVGVIVGFLIKWGRYSFRREQEVLTAFAPLVKESWHSPGDGKIG